jgi:FkbM family methyltransferase
LSANLALNPELASRVVPVQCFLGPQTDLAPPRLIPSAWPLTGDAEVHPKHLGESMTTTGARTLSLDDYLAGQGRPRVDFIKLDVDGFECEVFKGARQMLERDRPILIMELAPYVLLERGTSLEELIGYLAPHGYGFLTEAGAKELPNDAAGLAALVPEGASLNIVAIPKR